MTDPMSSSDDPVRRADRWLASSVSGPTPAGLVMDLRNEIERARAKLEDWDVAFEFQWNYLRWVGLSEYRDDPQCEAVGDVGRGVRCTRQAGHKGDHVGTLEEYRWRTDEQQ